MERIVGVNFAKRHHVADFGKKLIPALVRKGLSRRTAFLRAPIGEGIAERVVRSRPAIIVKVLVIGDPLGVGLTRTGGKDGLTGRVFCQRHRRLQAQPPKRLGELAGAEKRAARGAGRHLPVGARGINAKAILADKQAAGGENAPFEQLASRYLPVRACPDDLAAVLARLLSFPNASAGCVLWKIHVRPLSQRACNRDGSKESGAQGSDAYPACASNRGAPSSGPALRSGVASAAALPP